MDPSPPEKAFIRNDINIPDCILCHKGDYVTLSNSVSSIILEFSTSQEYFEVISVDNREYIANNFRE